MTLPLLYSRTCKMNASKIQLFFNFTVLSLSIISGETMNRVFLFSKIVEDKICKDLDCLFKLHANSLISCSIVCKIKDLCASFFYDSTTTQCTGSTLPGYEHQIREQIGPSFYQEVMNNNRTQSTSETTTDQTTPLAVTSTPIKRQTKTGTSDPEQTSSLPPDSLGGIWAEWNSSAYKILTGAGFKLLHTLCSDLTSGGHLAWIDGFDENDFVTSYLNSSGFPRAYIGFVRSSNMMGLEHHPGGKPVVFDAPWRRINPEGHECVAITSKGIWYSVSYTEMKQGICEKAVNEKH